MKPEPYSQEMLDAWRKTQKAYRELIRTGDGTEWYDYGAYRSCRFCLATMRDKCDVDTTRCKLCVLGPKSTNCTLGGVMYETYSRLCTELNRGDKSFHVQQAARERLEAIEKVVLPKLRRRGQLGNGKQHET